MTQSLKLTISQSDRQLEEIPLDQPLEIGRQRIGEPEPYRVQQRRLIITTEGDSTYFSRRHLTLEPMPNGLVRVRNHSNFNLEHDRKSIGPILPNGGQSELVPPFTLLCHQISMRVEPVELFNSDSLKSLHQTTRAPGEHLEEGARMMEAIPSLSATQREGLANWLQTFTPLLQSSLASTNLYEHAATAVVQLGLTTGAVLLREGDQWKVHVQKGLANALKLWEPSHQVLERLCEKPPHTFIRTRSTSATDDSPSLSRQTTVIAAPLLDREGNVLGALYGEGSSHDLSGAGRMEAALVELLAGAIASGLERDRLVRAQVQFEQFFGEQLARQLQKQPDLLVGRLAEVTLLFCDVRRFSTFCRSLTPAQVTEWMNDVLSELSACVLKEDGVLVDYIGDELLAMWGAPRSQPDQAARAARAGLAMIQQALPRINERWQATLGQPMQLGVGLNTGSAQVGNTGSKFKFKYGPLGDAVNLASRVQGVTKYLGCPLLMTRATREKLDERFIARRVCLARVVNIPEPVDLYEVEGFGSMERREFYRDSEESLRLLECSSFLESARAAAPLLAQHPGDKPLLLILSRATRHMLYPDAPFDKAWEPGGK